jgi:hypothetical protein
MICSGVVFGLILGICKLRFSSIIFLLSKGAAIDADTLLEVLEVFEVLEDIMLKLLKFLDWKIPSAI